MHCGCAVVVLLSGSKLIPFAVCVYYQVAHDVFDPTNPAGFYDLFLEMPYDQSVAQELLRLAGQRDTISFSGISYINEALGIKLQLGLKKEREAISRSTALWNLLRDNLHQLAEYLVERQIEAEDASDSDEVPLDEDFKTVEEDGSTV